MDAELRDAITESRASYDRCAQVPRFVDDFYARLFEVLPEAHARFAQTDFDRQRKLLRHAIGLLLSFPAERDGEPNILSRLAERHSRRDLAIEPSSYGPFLESLIDTVKRHDPAWTPAIEQAWRKTLAKGFAYMQSRY
ncbi:MAG TPA: globin domain-containing protein [Gemmatimonadales bacterium]|jgi:hemoglobin-like flavoprotein